MTEQGRTNERNKKEPNEQISIGIKAGSIFALFLKSQYIVRCYWMGIVNLNIKQL